MYPATEISSATFYLGQAGNVQVAIDGNVYIEGSKELLPNGNPTYTGIFDNTFWSANGGNLDFSAKSLEMTTAAGIQVVTLSVGNAGIASLDVGDLYVKDGSYISSNGFYGTGGNAGGVIIEADNIVIAGPESSNDPFGSDATGISTSSGVVGGIGGNIAITTGSLSLTNRSIITSISRGPGDGGNINIKAGKIEVLNGAQINAGAAGSGSGGVIDVEAGSVLVAGVHPDTYFEATAGGPTLAISGIASQALQNGGSGGGVIINADSLELRDSGRLTTETYGAGNAGNVQIFADRIFISGSNPVLEDFLLSSGADKQYAGA
jgi:large exoprotein involved in heme utilization and adhesion